MLVTRKLRIPMRSGVDNLLHCLHTLHTHGLFEGSPGSTAAYDYVCAAARSGSSVALEAAFSLYVHNPSKPKWWSEFVDTAKRVAAGWRAAHPLQQVLQVIQTLRASNAGAMRVPASDRALLLTAPEARALEQGLVQERVEVLYLAQAWAQRKDVDPEYALRV